jgi:hypothetical protein
MAYYVFSKENITSIYRIIENSNELNSYNLIPNAYHILEDSNQQNFLDCVLNKKHPVGSENIVTYIDIYPISYKNKEELDKDVLIFKQNIKAFLNNNPNNLLFNKWNDYYNQLSSLNTNNIKYPLESSIEQYFNNQNQPFLHTLQIP